MVGYTEMQGNRDLDKFFFLQDASSQDTSDSPQTVKWTC